MVQLQIWAKNLVIKMMTESIKEILKKRNNLSKEQYLDYSNKIYKKIMSLDEYKKSENLLIFYPYLGEVDVLPVALNALEHGKNVFFPKVTGETTMEFIKVLKLTEFNEGFKNIKEPIGNEIFDTHNITKKTIMILPGSTYDFHGNRTGYGKGYYDRYLENCYKNITKVGVCFELQLLEQIQNIKTTDIPMDYVIYENDIVRSKK